MTERDIQVCWLVGGYYQRLTILDQIKASFGDCELMVYHDEVTGEYIEQQITGNVLFGGKRLVILKEVPSFSGTAAKSLKRLQDMLENLPADVVVVFDGVDSKGNSALLKTVKRIGKIFEYPEYLKKDDAAAWVFARFEELGKHPEDGVASLVEELAGEEQGKGFEIDRLYLSVKNISEFVGGAKKIAIDDVLKAAHKQCGFIIWPFFDAIDKRETSVCHKMLETAFSSSDSPKKAAEFLLSMFIWRYRMLLFLKESLALGRSADQASADIQAIKKLTRSGTGWQTSYELDIGKDGSPKAVYSNGVVMGAVKGFYGKEPSVSYYNRSQLFKILAKLYDSMYKVRMGANDTECRLMCESLIEDICN